MDEIEELVFLLQALDKDPSDDDANRRFADLHAARTAALLMELAGWRTRASERHSSGGRVIVEGYDEDSAKGAFADALNKAARFFDARHDISVTVLGLMKLPHGGHRATVEVDMMPLTMRAKPDMNGPEEGRRRDHEREFRAFRKFEDAHLKELVHDHFLETTGGTPDVPDFFLINFNDAELLNHMIEKEFFKAGHTPEPARPEEVKPQVVVRIIKPDVKK